MILTGMPWPLIEPKGRRSKPSPLVRAILRFSLLSFPIACGCKVLPICFVGHSLQQKPFRDPANDVNPFSSVLLAMSIPTSQAGANKSCWAPQSFKSTGSNTELSPLAENYSAHTSAPGMDLLPTHAFNLTDRAIAATTDLTKEERENGVSFANSITDGEYLDNTFSGISQKKFTKSIEHPGTFFSRLHYVRSISHTDQTFPFTEFASKFLTPFKDAYRMALDHPSSFRKDSRKATEDTTIACKSEKMNGTTSESMSLRRIWRRRHARTLEEGIRREKAIELSNLLNRAQIDARRPEGRKYIERTLMGLLNALAEELEDLDIEFSTKPGTPIWRKEVEEIRINFSRLGFKPIRLGGSDKYDRKGNAIDKESVEGRDTGFSLVESADEAFYRIDKDMSGTLDQGEIAEALTMISELETDKESIEELASDLVSLYDANSDGVVDREEYQQMVEDMAQLRPFYEGDSSYSKDGPLKKVKDSVQSISKGISERAAQVAAAANGSGNADSDPNEREKGSIVLSGLNLDLRRLVFGGFPIVKRITPGGPLILEPFTATIRGSFTREDVMGSFLLDSGLRLLVARAIRVRVRSFRDVVDGAYFFGRQWKMTSKSAPIVQVLGLSNVEFRKDKMILTGRARIRTSPDAPVVTNTFKVRTKIGTGNNGQTIGLREPELAFVFECPQVWENGLTAACSRLGVDHLKRPEPYYSFFPIYSPFKVNENAGFDMGEDNQIRKIFIKDGKLRFEMRSVLRPGRFLGSHYLAFTLPMRTFIVTMDRLKEGIRVARKNKKIAEREKRLREQPGSPGEFSSSVFMGWIVRFVRGVVSRRWLFFRSFRLRPNQRSFFTRFVEGYTLVEREGEAKNEQLTNEISDWFGRQGNARTNETAAMISLPAVGLIGRSE